MTNDKETPNTPEAPQQNVVDDIATTPEEQPMMSEKHEESSSFFEPPSDIPDDPIYSGQSPSTAPSSFSPTPFSDITPQGLNGRLKSALKQNNIFNPANKSGHKRSSAQKTAGLTIRFKLLGTLSFLTILILMVGLFSVTNVMELKGLSENVAERHAKMARIAEEIRSTMYLTRDAEKEFMLLEEATAQERANRYVARIRNKIDAAKSLATEIRSRGTATTQLSIGTYAALQENLDTYVEKFAQQVKDIQKARENLNQNNQQIINFQRRLEIEADAMSQVILQIRIELFKNLTNKQIDTISEIATILISLQDGIASSQLNMTRFFENRALSHAELTQTALDDIQSQIMRLSNVQNSTYDASLNEIRKRFASYRAIIKEVRIAIEAADRKKRLIEPKIQAQKEELKVLGARLISTSTEISQSSWNAIEEESQSLISAGSNAQWILIVVATLGIIAGLIVLVVVPQPILSTIHQLLTHTNRISNGDLGQPVQVESRDELGQLANAFEGMRLALVPLVDRVRRASIQISSLVNEIQATSSQYASASNQQASALNEFSTTLSQVSQSAGTMLQVTQELANVSLKLSQSITSGNSKSNQTLTAMNAIGKSTQQTSNRINMLNEKMDSIGEAMNTIRSIADQTVLLSLNAAIEANKAGEAGKGFAIVAGEIRRLSERSITSATEIGNLIQDMQRSTENAVVTIDKSGEEIRQGIRQVGDVLTILTEIHQTMQQVSSQVALINSSVESQTEATRQAMNTVTELSSTANLSAQSGRQNAMVAYELNAMADQLKNAVAAFRLEEKK
ncbi:methyl-accepting chemotaxis protein [Magnetococcales bacterium HHB-1]